MAARPSVAAGSPVRGTPHLLAAWLSHRPSSACLHVLSYPFADSSDFPLALLFSKLTLILFFLYQLNFFQESCCLPPLSDLTPRNVVISHSSLPCMQLTPVRAGTADLALWCVSRPAQGLQSGSQRTLVEWGSGLGRSAARLSGALSVAPRPVAHLGGDLAVLGLCLC